MYISIKLPWADIEQIQQVLISPQNISVPVTMVTQFSISCVKNILELHSIKYGNIENNNINHIQCICIESKYVAIA